MRAAPRSDQEGQRPAGEIVTGYGEIAQVGKRQLVDRKGVTDRIEAGPAVFFIAQIRHRLDGVLTLQETEKLHKRLFPFPADDIVNARRGKERPGRCRGVRAAHDHRHRKPFLHPRGNFKRLPVIGSKQG